MIAVGILILVRREAILRLIFVIFGLVILTDALLRIQMSVEAKKFGLKLWWAVLLIAVTTGIFGMLLSVSGRRCKADCDFYRRGISAGGNTEALRGSIHCENP